MEPYRSPSVVCGPAMPRKAGYRRRARSIMTARDLRPAISRDRTPHDWPTRSTRRADRRERIVSADPRRARPLLPRLDISGARLDEAYLFLSAASREDPQPVPSEEWLRDNHHVVQDQVRDVVSTCRARYYLELPKLADGPFEGLSAGLPARTGADRAHGRAASISTPSSISPPRISGRAQLTIGEIWAVPIMMRLALVEELHRLADRRGRRAAQPRQGTRVVSRGSPRTDEWSG